jgi:hypothetical protein
MRTSVARHIVQRKILIDKDIDSRIKHLQKRLVRLHFSGENVTNEFQTIIIELKELRKIKISRIKQK